MSPAILLEAADALAGLEDGIDEDTAHVFVEPLGVLVTSGAIALFVRDRDQCQTDRDGNPKQQICSFSGVCCESRSTTPGCCYKKNIKNRSNMFRDRVSTLERVPD